ncbi:glutamyl-tRNA reductase [Edaphobacter bradus]|uniref:glutamyl-tRNA reductase n=1 Tax=Edaphobacter bradus TaxID=2259016 RepID=UPI0021DFB92D|nr:glutamyl-tRNA reductase [Edaphobacter bradus]
MSPPPKLVLLGINHTTAPIEVRERLAIPSERLADATRTLVHQPGIREGLILSTCNRVEFLTLQENGQPTQTADLLRFLHEYFALPPQSLQPHLYELREGEAIRHIFRVASSLDSMVVGEPQILGQVKESYTVAREVGALSGPLDALLQRAFTVAKKVRSETQIGSSSVSIASVAVDLARKIFGSLQGKTILLVGAGKMSELAARHLIQHGASNILVANRTESRAHSLAEQFAGSGVHTEALSFDSLYAEAPRADIVITSTGAPQKIFGRSNGQHFLHQRRNRPMFFIDIAVPRDVDPRMNEIEGCFVYDIDDLQQVAQANLADRSREAQAAETIVSREVDKYQKRLQARDAVPAILALQQNAEAIREAELKRMQSRLATLTPEQQALVDSLTRSLTAKLLHPQLVALRQAALSDKGNTEPQE